MNKPYPFGDISAALGTSQNAALLLPKEANFDLVAAALGLFLSLEKSGKAAAIAANFPLTVEFSHLVGLDRIGKEINQGRDLVISLDYPLDKIEKVSYNDDGGSLNLVIQPKSQSPVISPDKIKFKTAGEGTNFFFLFGGQGLESFGELISAETLQGKDSLSISREAVSPLGKIAITDNQASSYSEIIAALLASLSLPWDQDIAQNLYLGLIGATANFTSSAVGADTFEAAAILLRAGAKKEGEEVKKTEKAPLSSDWLEPKIYRGATLV